MARNRTILVAGYGLRPNPPYILPYLASTRAAARVVATASDTCVIAAEIDVTLVEIVFTAAAALCMFDDMSRASALCSSTAATALTTESRIVPIDSRIESSAADDIAGDRLHAVDLGGDLLGRLGGLVGEAFHLLRPRPRSRDPLRRRARTRSWR